MTGDTPRRDIPAVSVVPPIAVWSFLARSPGRSWCHMRRGGWCSAALRGISLGWRGRPTHPSDGGYFAARLLLKRDHASAGAGAD